MRALQVFLVDAALTLAFVVIGMAAHDSGSNFIETAWPFLAALVIAWLIPWVHRQPVSMRAGIIVWLITALGGLGLRAASDNSLSMPFPLVAIGFLLLFLVGWRIVPFILARPKLDRDDV